MITSVTLLTVARAITVKVSFNCDIALKKIGQACDSAKGGTLVACFKLINSPSSPSQPVQQSLIIAASAQSISNHVEDAQAFNICFREQ